MPARAASSRPLVLISYSTDALQNGPEHLQTALDALAGLPVTVLASTSRLFPVSRLLVPANGTVVEYVSHASVMPSSALVVCHAGHGTTMAALTRGVPLVCIPGLGRDQEPIAARVSELGLGVALERDATTSSIRGAVTAVLADGRYLQRAREFAQRAGGADGAERAAEALLAILDRG